MMRRQWRFKLLMSRLLSLFKDLAYTENQKVPAPNHASKYRLTKLDFFMAQTVNRIDFKRRSTSARDHSRVALLDIYQLRMSFSVSEIMNVKQSPLCDTVPNKPKYCNWPEGVPLWLIGGC